MKLRFPKIFLCFLFVGIGIFVSAQFKVPEKPKILYPVYDEVGLLNESETDLLNQKLIKFNDSTSVQIEVVILPTTNGEDVNFAAWKIGEKWGIRNKDAKNGIVFLIAKDDRTMSIQQGRDAEQYITASIAGQILDYLVTPSFKQNQFYAGIDHGTSAIMDAVRGKFKPIDNQENNGNVFNGNLSIFLVFIFFIILNFLIRNRGGNGKNDDDDITLSKHGHGGFFLFPGSFGGGFGGSSGGGFGGFGGGGFGGFGGGGASGGW
jgi:uncharacterized protein